MTYALSWITHSVDKKLEWLLKPMYFIGNKKKQSNYCVQFDNSGVFYIL